MGCGRVGICLKVGLSLRQPQARLADIRGFCSEASAVVPGVAHSLLFREVTTAMPPGLL